MKKQRQIIKANTGLFKIKAVLFGEHSVEVDATA